MRIAFLHQPNDPYTNIRIKYFVSQSHQVYSIVFYSKEKQKQLKGVKIISLPYYPIIRIAFFKRFIYFNIIRKITSINNIDIFYIISALNSYYLKSSKAKRNFLEIQGSDVITAPRKFPFLKLYYRKLWKYADGITQDSKLAKIKSLSFMPKDVINETIEIGVDFNVFNETVSGGFVREKFHLGDRPIVFHSRSIKELYNLETIIKSIPLVKNKFPLVCFMFTGD